MDPRARVSSSFDTKEARMLRLASRRLAHVPAAGQPTDIFDAIAACVPFEAGLLTTASPDAMDAMTNHAVRLPEEVLMSWMSTRSEYVKQAFAALLFSAEDGAFWRDRDSLRGSLRDGIEVLGELGRYGLGDGAGYKVLERRLPGRGTEHVMLAMLTARGDAFPDHANALLGALNAGIRAAVLRIGLPLIASKPIIGQCIEEQSSGYICLSLKGTLIEANQRAHHLVMNYRHAMGLPGSRRVFTAFVDKVRHETMGGRVLYLPSVDGSATLEVRAHLLAKEAHSLPEDVLLVVMREFPLPTAPPVGSSPAVILATLTERQQQIAYLLVHTGDSYKQIAARLGISARTVGKHAERIYRALGVHSRPELTMQKR